MKSTSSCQVVQDSNNPFQVNYSCKEKSENTVGGTNQKQMRVMQEKCKHSNACRIEASRDFFGDSECPGTDDAEMTLWLVYSCNGDSDKSSSHKPTCKPGTGTGTGTDACSAEQSDVEQGEMTQVDIPGCGGWVNIDCNGGCINICKGLRSYIYMYGIRVVHIIIP